MDYLPHTQIQIEQDSTLFKMTSSACRLGELFSLQNNEKFLDIGCNTGLFMLYAHLKAPYALKHGLDINSSAISLARKNMALNSVSNYELFCCDVKNFTFKNSYDVIVCNPPFYDKDRSYKITINESARVSINLSLEELLLCAETLLKNDGKFYLMLPKEQYDNLTNLLTKSKLTSQLLESWPNDIIRYYLIKKVI
jgi:tRNA1(Val) A37 N6-methylase TrmN6